MKKGENGGKGHTSGMMKRTGEKRNATKSNSCYRTIATGRWMNEKRASKERERERKTLGFL